MATAIQENGMKPLTNKSLNHVKDVNTLDNANSCAEGKDNMLFDGQLQSYVGHTEQPREESREQACEESFVHDQLYEEVLEESPELDIVINNVVCSFSVRSHLNLRQIALSGSNVEYRRENGMVTMKLRKPYTTASIWSSGKVTCTGATSEAQAKIAARRFARCLHKLGFKVRFSNYRVVNVLGTCSMPFAIKITSFSIHHKENADYEPELHPGVTYKLTDPKATLKIFSTGSVTVTAPNVEAVEKAILHIYPLVYEFRKERSAEDELALATKKRKLGLNKKKSDEFLEEEPDSKYESMISDAEGVLDEVGSDASWD
ncbi:PREDICTED: TATA box-binding protein-like protein 1 [Vollenhovia emeryi]|uniref:TATA box-binding protein-like protein 1 n=1 Tax=Vollenhovia emeryi TaxID=411798 RepID=UPI0005F362FA|nr:PREDICTED: TATA box-binding protein-like protein 1 [Vollenhovia emeryi]XP_011863306.1 PREDICTED: TATA box-binding protein-like protein 1 [Vollenhovia emeryi]XP_011863307.1 PREDICTED: TATA box-binding protein-like protein 1 [Vollenhovia emeryi]